MVTVSADYQTMVEAAIQLLGGTSFARRMWDGDGSLWTQDPELARALSGWLGWLWMPEVMAARVDELRGFVDGLRNDGFAHAVVLGMGGSSLAPDVLRETFGAAPGYLSVDTLDSTDPGTIRDLEARLDLDKTLFIVASKSGTTTEAISFMEYFWSKVPNGRQFVAITDPGTPLEQTAHERGFRRVFPHPVDVGGRYAALTYIGMVPAACLGMDLARLLERAQAMAGACGPNQPALQNPGMTLGGTIGALAHEGRDKLTLICSPGIASFGYWVEQLVAESTGKAGKGILPVEGEPLGPPEVYGPDRLFVYMRLDSEPDEAQDAAVAALEGAAFPVARIHLADRYDLGGEFFRWEFAVPVAAALIGVEPFEQPNVQESKDNTNRLLKQYAETGSLPQSAPLLTGDGLALYAQGPAGIAIDGARTIVNALKGFFALIRPLDYVAFTAYVEPTEATERQLDAMRAAVRDRFHVATTSGYGPRFLHSTGQLHKGGGPGGVFIQITASSDADIEVPGKPYTFGVLKAAQALGDLQALQSRGRRAIRVDLGTDVDGGLTRLGEVIRDAT